MTEGEPKLENYVGELRTYEPPFLSPSQIRAAVLCASLAIGGFVLLNEMYLHPRHVQPAAAAAPPIERANLDHCFVCPCCNCVCQVESELKVKPKPRPWRPGNGPGDAPPAGQKPIGQKPPG